MTQIFAINADNASPNDTQTTTLSNLKNSFHEVNRVHCFNHTLQLSAHTLIKPFNSGMKDKKTNDNNDTDSKKDDTDDPEMPALEDFEDDNNNIEGTEENGEELDDPQDDLDELKELTDDEREALLENTAIVRNAVTKVRLDQLLFSSLLLTLFHFGFENYRLPLFILPPLLFLPGVHVQPSTSNPISFPGMLLPAGIRRMI